MVKKYDENFMKLINSNVTLLYTDYNYLRSDKAFIMELSCLYNYGFAFAADELKKNKDFVLEVINRSPFIHYVLRNSAYEIRNDKYVIMQAVKKDYTTFVEASDELRNDDDYISFLSIINPNVKYLGLKYDTYRKRR